MQTSGTWVSGAAFAEHKEQRITVDDLTKRAVRRPKMHAKLRTRACMHVRQLS